jgi:hypothetical protein
MVRLNLGEGDALLIVRGATGSVELGYDETNLTESALVAIGLARALEDEEWRKRLVAKARTLVAAATA